MSEKFVVKMSRIEQNSQKPQSFHALKLIRYTVVVNNHNNMCNTLNKIWPQFGKLGCVHTVLKPGITWVR